MCVGLLKEMVEEVCIQTQPRVAATILEHIRRIQSDGLAMQTPCSLLNLVALGPYSEMACWRLNLAHCGTYVALVTSKEKQCTHLCAHICDVCTLP